MSIDPYKIIDKYYADNPKAKALLIHHSECVANFAEEIAIKKKLKVNLKFLKEAALLHDIGIFKCKFDILHIHGDDPYYKHGVNGFEILKNEGLENHALVCERHIGTGLSLEDIKKQNLDLPKRDMIPISIEEKLICYADKFFTKISDGKLTYTEARAIVAKFGEDKGKILDKWHKEFSID